MAGGLLSISSVQLDTLLNTRFSEVVGLLEEVGFRPHQNCTVEMTEGERRKSVADGRCDDVQASFAEFRRCSAHCQVAMLHRPETDTATESRRRYTDVPQV